MKITKMILQIAAFISATAMFAYTIINEKAGSLIYCFADDYLILAALSLLLIIGFNRNDWGYKGKIYINTAISISAFAMFTSSLFHAFVEIEPYYRVTSFEFIASSVMNILPFAVFALAMIKTIYRKNEQVISNALPIISLVIMLSFGVASYYIENQSKHWIVIAMICVLIICSKIIENRILNKEALGDV